MARQRVFNYACWVAWVQFFPDAMWVMPFASWERFDNGSSDAHTAVMRYDRVHRRVCNKSFHQSTVLPMGENPNESRSES